MARPTNPVVHFVGFRDDRFHAAVKVFGRPAFFHRVWDVRAQSDIAPEDTVVFAEGDETQPVRSFSFDDSSVF
jgi:hypothetical protein